MSAKPLRVLMVTARYLPDMGGIETHVNEVSRRLAMNGDFEITVLATDRTRSRPDREVIEGVTVLRVPGLAEQPGLLPCTRHRRRGRTAGQVGHRPLSGNSHSGAGACHAGRQARSRSVYGDIPHGRSHAGLSQCHAVHPMAGHWAAIAEIGISNSCEPFRSRYLVGSSSSRRQANHRDPERRDPAAACSRNRGHPRADRLMRPPGAV